jgi:BirA family biotin operon repressor/biotin-[acetyl-CoA-carboxylase] ligase
MITIFDLDECGSTNDEAWRKLSSAPALVLARRQSSGRGRQGRRWKTGEGNLFASLVVSSAPSALNWIPLAAGVAAFDAVARGCELRGGADLSSLRLKWPNDLYWSDRKMGGILCESRVVGDRVEGVVIGLGINVARAPEVEELKTASMLEHLASGEARWTAPALEALRLYVAREWALALLERLESLARGNTPALRAAWLERAKLDRFPELSAHDRGGALVRLRALDLDPSGKLKADTGSKVVFLDQSDQL